MKKYLMIAIVALAACKQTTRRPPPAGEAVEPGEPAIPVTDTVDDSVARGYVGVLTPRVTSEVVAPFSTVVTEMKVDLGAKVKKGDVLAVLDDGPGLEELKIAKANYKAQRASVRSAAAERRAAKDRLKTEERAKKAGVASAMDVSKAGADSSKAGAEVARASATADEQKARIEQLEKKLQDSSLKAPIDGQVAKSYAKQGDRVEEDQPVIRIITDELFVRFAIPSDQAGALAPGDTIEIEITAQNRKVRGIVRSVAPELDPGAQMILAEAELESPPADLQSGLECRIRKLDKTASK